MVGGKLEKHRDNDEWVLVVETCHQCECHRQEWLRHDPQDYRSGLEVVRSACRALDGARPVHCFHLETPDLGQRIGAFEVFLLPPRICEPAYFAYLVHSKLLTRKWPSHQSLVHRLRDDMPRLDQRGWKLALHGLKSNLDIFSCWKKAQEEVKHLEEEMGELASHAEKKVADLEQQLSELPEVQYQVEQLEDEKSDLVDQLKSCQQDCDAFERRGKELEREMQQMKESSLVAERELKRQLQKTENQLQERDATIKALLANQQQMLEAQEIAGSSNQALQKELETARVEWAKCEVQILHLEEEQRKFTAERDLRRNEISGLNEELDEMKSGNLQLQKQLEEIQRDSEMKDARLSQIGELELAIQQLEHQKQELTESLQVCEQQKWVAETEQKSLNRSILSTSLREKELQKELWLMEEIKVTAEEELRVELEELKAKLEEKEAKSEEKDITIRELAASQTCLLDAQQKAGMAREAQQRELEVLRQQHQEFEGQIRCLEDEKQKLGSKQEAQRSEVDGLRQELEEMEMRNSQLERQQEQLEESLRLAAQHQADRSAGQATLSEPPASLEPPPMRAAQVPMQATLSEPPASLEPPPMRAAQVPMQATLSEPPASLEPPPMRAAQVPMQATLSEPPASLEPPPMRAAQAAPSAPTDPPVLLEPRARAATVEDVMRSEVSDEEVSTVSTDTDIDVADSDEDSAVMY